MRISDWSSDVCSADLEERARTRGAADLVDHRPPRKGVRAAAAGQGLRQAGEGHAADRLHHRRQGDARRAPPARRGAGDRCRRAAARGDQRARSEEHTSELQSLMRISYAVFCLKKKTKNIKSKYIHQHISQHLTSI